MAYAVNKVNTKIYAKDGWVKLVHDTGQKDADGKTVTVMATITQAAIEESAGKLLPKARVKVIVEAALNATAVDQEQELAAL